MDKDTCSRHLSCGRTKNEEHLKQADKCETKKPFGFFQTKVVSLRTESVCFELKTNTLGERSNSANALAFYKVFVVLSFKQEARSKKQVRLQSVFQ